MSTHVSATPSFDEKRSSVASSDGPDYTPDEERRLLRKIDWRLMPGLTLLYLLSFLDRTNVGNAKLGGMLVDIGLTDSAAYNTGLALYFVSPPSSAPR